MLKLSVLQTGSVGNSILLDNGSNVIALDMGMSAKLWTERASKQGYSFEDIDSVFISHAHSDHVNTSLNKFIAVKGNENVYTTGAVANDISRKSKLSRFKLDKIRIVEKNEWYHIGSFWVMPIKMVHTGLAKSSINECVGYDIYDTVNKKRIIFATDTQTLEYVNVPEDGYDLLLLEENHDANWIQELFELGAQDIRNAHILTRSRDHHSVQALGAWLLQNNHKNAPHVPLHESSKGKRPGTIRLKDKQYYETYWKGEETNE